MPALVNTLLSTTAIVDGEGRPTPYFMRQWLSQGVVNEDVTGLQPQIDAILGTTLTAGTGLSGGGDLSADRTFDLEDTAVTPGVYGDEDNVAQITIDAQGRLTAAVEVAIAGGGGGGGAWELLTTETFSGVTDATMDWTDASDYAQIMVVFQSVTSDTDQAILSLRARQGGADVASASYERWTRARKGSSVFVDNATATTVWLLPAVGSAASWSLGNEAEEQFSGVFCINDPGDTSVYKLLAGRSSHLASDGRVVNSVHTGLMSANTAAIDGIRIGANSGGGTIAGVMQAYGLLKSGGGGGSGGGGKLQLLGETVFSGVAAPTFDWSNPELYSEIRVVLEDIETDTDGANIVLRARQGGVTRNTGGDYSRSGRFQTGGTVTDEGSASAGAWTRFTQSDMGNAAGEGCEFICKIINPGGTVLSKIIRWEGGYQNTAGVFYGANGGGQLLLNTDAVDGVELSDSFAAGLSGTIRAYGLLKA